MTDGTVPEDFLIQLQCPHRTSITLPWSFEVWVLRYAPAAYAPSLGRREEILYSTRFFSWKPMTLSGKQASKIRVRLRKIERIIPGTEVSEEERSDRATVGPTLEFDNEGHGNVCSDSDGPIPLSQSFDVEDVETDFKIDAEMKAGRRTTEAAPRSERDERDGMRSQATSNDETNLGRSELEEQGTERVTLYKDMPSSASGKEYEPRCSSVSKEVKLENLDVGLESISVYEKETDR